MGEYAAVTLLIFFGLKSIKDAWGLPSNAVTSGGEKGGGGGPELDEYVEAEELLKEKVINFADFQFVDSSSMHYLSSAQIKQAYQCLLLLLIGFTTSHKSFGNSLEVFQPYFFCGNHLSDLKYIAIKLASW